MKGAGLQRVKLPPGNWFAPPGNNRNGGGGNEAVGAFGEFWLDPDDLDVDAYEAGGFRASRPDRALFIRRLIATCHKPRTSRQLTVPKPPVTRPAPQVTSASPIATARQILERAWAPPAVRERELSSAQANEISQLQGLGICWQPGNKYRITRTANEKSCLSQFDLDGRELARYGSW